MYYYKMDPFNYYYNTDQVQHYDGSKDFSWDARIIANVILPWAVSLQVTGSYNSGAKNPQGKDYESYWLDAGLRRSFLGKKISVAITARDLLDSRRHKYYSYGENFFQDGRMQWGGRNFGISVSYNFGTNGKKKNGKPNGQNGNREDGGGEGDMMDL